MSHVEKKSLRSDVGRYAMLPEWLLTTTVSDKAIRLFAILASKYADRDGVAYPSRAKLARDLGLAKPESVDAPARELEGVGALVVTRKRRDEDRGHLPNIYTLSFSRPAAEGIQNEGLPSPEKGARGSAEMDERSPESWGTLAPKSPPTLAPENGHDPEKYLTRAIEPEGERVADATLRSPAGLIAVWNALREPGPKVGSVPTANRSRHLGRALDEHPRRDDWSTAILWLNRQRFANAPGSGDAPTWRASLDWLAKPGQLEQVLESARTDAAHPPPRPTRVGDTPAAGLTDEMRAILDRNAKRRSEAKAALDKLVDEASALVLDMSVGARGVLERAALLELEAYRDRADSPAQFDEWVCKALPLQLIKRAKDRPLADVAAELEKAAAA